MQLNIRQLSPQTGGGNSHINQKEEGKAGKSGSKQRTTKKTTEKPDDSVQKTKKNPNSVD